MLEICVLRKELEFGALEWILIFEFLHFRYAIYAEYDIQFRDSRMGRETIVFVYRVEQIESLMTGMDHKSQC